MCGLGERGAGENYRDRHERKHRKYISRIHFHLSQFLVVEVALQSSGTRCKSQSIRGAAYRVSVVYVCAVYLRSGGIPLCSKCFSHAAETFCCCFPGTCWAAHQT
jgi:hypothetical protein